MRLIVRLLLMALAFTWIMPMFAGVQLHGGFLNALVLAFIFGLVLWIVDAVAIALSAVLAVTTFGMALLWLVPVWVLGFWLLPAVALKAVSDLMPGYLTIHGWTPAILGGLVLMLISLVTSESLWRSWTRSY